MYYYELTRAFLCSFRRDLHLILKQIVIILNGLHRNLEENEQFCKNLDPIGCLALRFHPRLADGATITMACCVIHLYSVELVVMQFAISASRTVVYFKAMRPFFENVEENIWWDRCIRDQMYHAKCT